MPLITKAQRLLDMMNELEETDRLIGECMAAFTSLRAKQRDLRNELAKEKFLWSRQAGTCRIPVEGEGGFYE